jgi:hypothetical protein
MRFSAVASVVVMGMGMGMGMGERYSTARPGGFMLACMCRNIRVLHHFEPPTTPDEIRAAALQYVRKVGGLNKPAPGDLAAFNRAVEEVALATERLLGGLLPRGAARTREREREKARERWKRREASMAAQASAGGAGASSSTRDE